MQRKILELGIKEFLFQSLTTPMGWEWEYEYNERTGELENLFLIDEKDSPIALYEAETCTLSIRGMTGIAKFDYAGENIRKLQRFVLKWVEKLEEAPESGWSKDFKLYEFRRTLDERAVRENATLLPKGWEWYTRIQDGYSWLESPKGKVVCEYDFENETFCYEEEWRDIHHEDEIDFRRYIERRTRQKMRQSHIIG